MVVFFVAAEIMAFVAIVAFFENLVSELML